ncbi:MAG: hypothetical protein RLY86_1272 [Pseudomonadota bacterium]|jgi:tRNA threonylcarbamoyladenosine biosynthesis protein TsaB
MLTLGLETATSACAAALWDGGAGRLVAAVAEPMTRGQAERLIPLVQELLAGAGIGFDRIDRYGVTVGPGTFTGLRIGLAAARGLALAAGKPLVGITTFEAVAHGVPPADAFGRIVLACVESRREDLFLQAFDGERRPLTPPTYLLPADLAAWAMAQLSPAPLLLAGDAAERAALALGPWPMGTARRTTTGVAEAADGATAVARLTATLAAADLATRPADPFYLRPPDVTVPGRSAPGAAP